PLGDLTNRVPLEIVAEIGFAHVGLLASKLGRKASTNLGAIQSAHANTPLTSLSSHEIPGSLSRALREITLVDCGEWRNDDWCTESEKTPLKSMAMLLGKTAIRSV
ncbi:hypothetical protein, partial [Devosia sp. A369]